MLGHQLDASVGPLLASSLLNAFVFRFANSIIILSIGQSLVQPIAKTMHILLKSLLLPDPGFLDD